VEVAGGGRASATGASRATRRGHERLEDGKRRGVGAARRYAIPRD